jgi:hypothetical protein
VLDFFESREGVGGGETLVGDATAGKAPEGVSDEVIE